MRKKATSKEAVVAYLKRVRNERPKQVAILAPIDHAYQMIAEVRCNARRDLARDILVKLHENGIVNLEDYA